MSKSWGHTVRPLTEAEINSNINQGKHDYQWHLKYPREGFVPDEATSIAWRMKCSISRHCKNEATHVLRYHYVTGKAGRTSWAEKQICAAHAAKYIVNPQTESDGNSTEQTNP